MFEPKFCLFLKKEAFLDKSAECLGSQLIEIIEFLDEKIPAHAWYGANIVANRDAWGKYEGFKLTYIGDSEILIDKAKTTTQLNTGFLLQLGQIFYPKK